MRRGPLSPYRQKKLIHALGKRFRNLPGILHAIYFTPTGRRKDIFLSRVFALG
jgi:hypothetical protein